MSDTSGSRAAVHHGSGGRLSRGIAHLASELAEIALGLFVFKPVALFIWWLSHRANTIRFRERVELCRRIERAVASGRPVLVASNHVSWFDDPVIPMALHGTGQRTALELIALGGAIALCWALPDSQLPPPAGIVVCTTLALVIARFGTHKTWWTLGDLVNLSDASVLRGKLALTRRAPPGRVLRTLLSLADPMIRCFMRTRMVRTIFVDRRAGEEAKRIRSLALEQTLDVAARLEPVWLFFEGGRTKVPGTIAPARRGIGVLVEGLRERGFQPFVAVVYHRGMERLIPPGGDRFLSLGHHVEVRWAEFDVYGLAGERSRDPQAVAESVREEALRLQAEDHAAGA